MPAPRTRALDAVQNESGSAEAATSMPSHGSNNPYPENAVNKQHCNAAPPSAQPALPPELFPTAVNDAALAGLGFRELSDLYDASRTLMSVVAGLGCQPRFKAEGYRSRFNAAGAHLDLFHELAAACLTAIVDEAEDRVPTNRDEAMARAWLLARDGATVRDDFAEFRALVEREAESVTGDAATDAGPSEAPGADDRDEIVAAMQDLSPDALDELLVHARQAGASADAAGDIATWFAEWRMLHERDIDGETAEESDAKYVRFAELQDLIVGAEATTPQDVAMQFYADSGASGGDHSKEFTARMLALATEGVFPARASATDPFVKRMKNYDVEVAQFNASEDDAAEDPTSRLCAEIQSGELAIGSNAGAAIALRRLVAIDAIIDTEGDAMVAAVLAFLEGRT